MRYVMQGPLMVSDKPTESGGKYSGLVWDVWDTEEDRLICTVSRKVAGERIIRRMEEALNRYCVVDFAGAWMVWDRHFMCPEEEVFDSREDAARAVDLKNGKD